MDRWFLSRKHQFAPKTFSRVSKPKPSLAIQNIRNENERAQNQSNQQQIKFLSILSNSCMQEKISMKYAFYALGSIVFVFLSTFFVTLIPVHDVIKYPNYWYEMPLQASFALIPCVAGNVLFRTAFYVNMESIKTHRNFQKLLLKIIEIFVVFLLSQKFQQ